MPRISTPEEEADHRRVGLRLKSARRAAGLSQKQVGEALGVTFQQVQKYEHGRNRLSANALQRICDLLEVPYQSLLIDGPIERAVEALASEAGERDVATAQQMRELLHGFALIRDPAVRRSISSLVLSLAKPEGNP